MIKKLINCLNCSNSFLINNKLTYINNYNICENCYDINSENYENNKNINYFNIIDKSEKAYLLGLFYYNLNIDNKNIVIYNFYYKNDLILYKLIQLFGYDIVNKYNSSISAYKLEFIIKDITLNDIIRHYDNFFNFDNDELKLSFIRGYYEGSINNSYMFFNDVILKYKNIDNILKIVNYINIPYIINNKLNQITYKNGNNSVDFLGKLYNNSFNISIDFYNKFKNNTYCKVFKTDENAIIPYKTRESDVGYDLTVIKEHKKINSNTILFDTGIQIELSNGYYSEIVPRSSLIKSGYMLANSIGIIDNSYRGNLLIALIKINNEEPDLKLPFKCCQLIIKKQNYIDLYETEEELSSTERNKGGFGSTG